MGIFLGLYFSREANVPYSRNSSVEEDVNTGEFRLIIHLTVKTNMLNK